MKTAGIREARQRLSELLNEVRKGREILLTDRGRPVAKLIPPGRALVHPFTSHRSFRLTMRMNGEALSRTVIADREDRL